MARLTSCFALAFIIGLSQLVAADEIKAPHLKIEKVEYNFGSVAEGDKVEHDFILKNVGTSDLVINRVLPSCGCTASDVSPNTVAPGAAATLHVSFDSTGFAGEKVKSIRILTNDPDEPTAMVSIRGVVESDITVEPKRVVFGDVVRGMTFSKKVSVRIAQSSSASITGVAALSQAIEIRNIAGTAKQKTFEVALKSDLKPGEVRERVVVNLAGARAASINIPVFGTVQGALRLRPSAVSFGVVEPNTTSVRRVVQFENLSEEPISITSVKSDNPAVSTSYRMLKKGRAYEIEVSLDGSKITNELRALVEVSTDSKTNERISFSVFGVHPATSSNG